MATSDQHIPTRLAKLLRGLRQLGPADPAALRRGEGGVVVCYPITSPRVKRLRQKGARVTPSGPDHALVTWDHPLDVLAVNLETKKIRVFGRDKAEPDAEAIISMAVMRRGVDTEFYTTAPAGKYAEGDAFDDWPLA